MRYSNGINVSFNLLGNTQDGERKTKRQKHTNKSSKTQNADSFVNFDFARTQLKDSMIGHCVNEENYTLETVGYCQEQQLNNYNPKLSKTNQSFLKKTQPVPVIENSGINNSGLDDKNVKPNKTHSGNSWIIALLLCIFFGIIGAHRFYLGYTGIGIIQLLTFGLLGIWTLIDFIRILTGSLKPKDGDYFDY